jgi:chromosome segregation ATPase
VADRTDPETGLTPEDMLDVIADAQVDSAALQHRIRALEAERDGFRNGQERLQQECLYLMSVLDERTRQRDAAVSAGAAISEAHEAAREDAKRWKQEHEHSERHVRDAYADAKAAESRSAALEEALRGLAERWGRVAEGGLTAHDAHTMLSEVRALASGTTGEGTR